MFLNISASLNVRQQNDKQYAKTGQTDIMSPLKTIAILVKVGADL